MAKSAAVPVKFDPEYFDSKDVLFDKLNSDVEREWCFAINFEKVDKVNYDFDV